MNQIEAGLRGRGFYVDRMNSGNLRQRDSRGKWYMIKLHPAGTPDLMAFRKEWVEGPGGLGYFAVKLLFVEVKAEGGKPTRLQQWKMQELGEKGAKCILAYSWEDVEKVLQ